MVFGTWLLYIELKDSAMAFVLTGSVNTLIPWFCIPLCCLIGWDGIGEPEGKDYTYFERPCIGQGYLSFFLSVQEDYYC